MVRGCFLGLFQNCRIRTKPCSPELQAILPPFCHYTGFSWTTGSQGECRKAKRQHHLPGVCLNTLCGRALSICNQFSSHLRNTIKTEMEGWGEGEESISGSNVYSERILGLPGTILPPSAALLHSSTLQGRNTKSRKDSNCNFYSYVSLISHHQKEKACGRLRGSVPTHNTLRNDNLQAASMGGCPQGATEAKGKGHPNECLILSPAFLISKWTIKTVESQMCST